MKPNICALSFEIIWILGVDIPIDDVIAENPEFFGVTLLQINSKLTNGFSIFFHLEYLKPNKISSFTQFGYDLYVL